MDGLRTDELPSRSQRCYAVADLVRLAGITDFSEGRYDRVTDSYRTAQNNKKEWVLDNVGCGPEMDLLDIGCGYGELLKKAQHRGAAPVGITISPQQVAYCQARRLPAGLIDFWKIGPEWLGVFQGIVICGAEHLVDVSDACDIGADHKYRMMFTRCRQLLDRKDRFMVTSVIHSREGSLDPEEISLGPDAFERGTPGYHWAMLLERTFGGWLPSQGQLERCAEGQFRLIAEEDGTLDYHLTSEYWLQKVQRALRYNPRLWLGLLCGFLRDRQATRDMWRCLLTDQSWAWQFRGSPSPAMSIRQLWRSV